MSYRDLPERACPICDDKSSECLYQNRFHSLPDGSPVAGYDVVVCKRCGFAFADHIPPVETFDDYYNRLARVEAAYGGQQDSVFDTERFIASADYVSKQFSNKSIRIVDVGCGRGGLLCQLRKRGFDNAVGLDPSSVCAKVVDQLYQVPVTVGTISQNELPKNHFDLMILFGVLEHVPNVKQAVACLADKLLDGGFVIVDVPDGTSFQNWPDAPFQEFSIEHINYFAPVSLTNLLKVCGFSLVETLRWNVQYSASTVMPHVKGLYQKRSPKPMDFQIGEDFQRDDETEPALRQYIEQSNKEEERVAAILESVSAKGDQLFVWGAGTHTLHLLESTALGKCNIAGFIDSNPKLQGQELQGRPIYPPSVLKKQGQPVIISSRVYQSDIIRQIRDDLKSSNELILLYFDH